MSQPQLPRFVGLRRQVSDAIGPRTPIVSTWRKVPNLFYSFLQGAGLATGDLKQTVPLLPPPFYFKVFFFFVPIFLPNTYGLLLLLRTYVS